MQYIKAYFNLQAPFVISKMMKERLDQYKKKWRLNDLSAVIDLLINFHTKFGENPIDLETAYADFKALNPQKPLSIAEHIPCSRIWVNRISMFYFAQLREVINQGFMQEYGLRPLNEYNRRASYRVFETADFFLTALLLQDIPMEFVVEFKAKYPHQRLMCAEDLIEAEYITQAKHFKNAVLAEPTHLLSAE